MVGCGVVAPFFLFFSTVVEPWFTMGGELMGRGFRDWCKVRAYKAL